MKFLLFGAICGLFLVDHVFSITRLVLRGTDFVDSGTDLEVPQVVNYLHGTKWNKLGYLGYHVHDFTECTHHISQIVPRSENLLDVATQHNRNRLSIAAEHERQFRLWKDKDYPSVLYQSRACQVPSCISSLDDLLVCGGIGLSVREWATVTGIDPRLRDEGPRGIDCNTHRVGVWMDDTQSKILPGDHAVQDMLAMVNFARKPVICEWVNV